MLHLITFTDHRMTKSADNLVRSAMTYGAERTAIYGPQDFPLWFNLLAEAQLKNPKGAGTWVWKPWVVWHYIHDKPDGDIVVYADAGNTIINNLNLVADQMKQDIMFFSNGWPHINWCKMDVYNAILGPVPVDSAGNYPAELIHPKQVQASLIFFKLTPQTRKLIKEWMIYCLQPGFCDDSPSIMPNFPSFADTRHDQAVITCLQQKYGYALHWFPTTTAMHIKAEYPNDTYPAIVEHHRLRNPGTGEQGNPEWK